jgi:hypothetical protein
MKLYLFLISIVLFCAISFSLGYSTIEGFDISRSSTYHADMFGSNECPRNGACRETSFKPDTQYLLI